MLKLTHSSVFKVIQNNGISRTFLKFESTNQQPTKISNTSLFKLRKSTGYALSKCKEALEKNNQNIEEATKYLNDMAQKEGWSKAEKLKNRHTTQGTLVFCHDRTKHQAAIIEINCETDFVARNEKFLDLSSQLALSVLKNSNSTLPKQLLKKDDILKLGYLNESNKTIGDQVALSIGSLGENMALRRAVIFTVQPGQTIGWYMHGTIMGPMNSCHFGKYGALVNISLTQKNENYMVEPFDIGRQICQQIVGMNPKSIGEMPAVRPPSEEPISIAENETRLLYQEFLMKPNTRVLDFLFDNYTLVNDFVRLECGEELPSDENQ